MQTPMYIIGSFLLGFVGIGLVLIGAALLKRYVLTDPRLLSLRLVVSHSLIVLIVMALGCFGILIPSVPYDDVEVGFLLVPGIHLYLMGEQFSLTCFPHLLKFMSSHEASLICIVVIPGLIGLLLGGFQWYLLGYLYQKSAKYFQLG